MPPGQPGLSGLIGVYRTAVASPLPTAAAVTSQSLLGTLPGTFGFTPVDVTIDPQGSLLVLVQQDPGGGPTAQEVHRVGFGPTSMTSYLVRDLAGMLAWRMSSIAGNAAGDVLLTGPPTFAGRIIYRIAPGAPDAGVVSVLFNSAITNSNMRFWCVEWDGAGGWLAGGNDFLVALPGPRNLSCNGMGAGLVGGIQGVPVHPTITDLDYEAGGAVLAVANGGPVAATQVIRVSCTGAAGGVVWSAPLGSPAVILKVASCVTGQTFGYGGTRAGVVPTITELTLPIVGGPPLDDLRRQCAPGNVHDLERGSQRRLRGRGRPAPRPHGHRRAGECRLRVSRHPDPGNGGRHRDRHGRHPHADESSTRRDLDVRAVDDGRRRSQ